MQYLMRLIAVSLALVLFTSPLRADSTMPPDANKMCPVMTDQPARADRFVDYQGKRIYFCCEKCVARFQKEPSKFLEAKDPVAAATSPKDVGWSWNSVAQLFGRLHVAVVHFPIALLML